MNYTELPQDKLQIVQPPEFIFKNKDFQLSPEKKVIVPMGSYLFHHMEFPESGGMLAYFQDCPFPAKGFPFPQAIYASNGVKRIFRASMDMISYDMLLPAMGFLLLRKKTKLRIMSRLLESFDDMARQLLGMFYLDRTKWSECPREIFMALRGFLIGMGIEENLSERFAEDFATLIQYDDAYRIRIMDIMSETTKEKLLAHPVAEMKKLINILAHREPSQDWRENLKQGNVTKFMHIVWVLRFLFFSPKFKKSFIKTIKESQFSNFQYDDADLYHSMLRADYDIKGYPIGQRVKMYEAWHSVFPPLPPRTIAKL